MYICQGYRRALRLEDVLAPGQLLRSANVNEFRQVLYVQQGLTCVWCHGLINLITWMREHIEAWVQEVSTTSRQTHEDVYVSWRIYPQS